MAPARGAAAASQPRFRRWRFCRWALLATAAAVATLVRGGNTDGFATTSSTPQSRFRGRRILRRASEDGQQQDQMMEFMYPKELMWQKPNKNVLIENYPGARTTGMNVVSVIVPPASLGFLVQGVSIWLIDHGQPPLVDMFPAIGQFFENLRPTEEMTWWPGGFFMSIYGTGGLFVITPLVLFTVLTNPGKGGAEFNKKTRKFTITRNGEVQREVDFDDIDTVELEYSGGFVTGRREVFFKLTSGEPVYFMETVDEKPKIVLEKQASDLALFLGKKLNYVEM